MSKYKEVDVLKIKQDMVVLQNERASLETKLDEAREELKSIQDGIAIWRGVYRRVNETIVNRVNAGAEELKKISREKEVAQEELTESQRLLGMLNTAIAEARKKTPEDNTGFLRSVLSGLQQKIVELAGKKANMEDQLAALDGKRRSLDLSLRKLESDKASVIDQIRALMDGIAAGEEKYSNVMTELGKLESTLAAIEARERDSRIMEARLSEEYRKVYFSKHGA